MSVVLWNVNGWSEKTKDIKIEAINITKPDIILFCETKLLKANELNIVGYKSYLHNRKLLKTTAKSGSGGVAILLNMSFRNNYFVNIVDRSVDGVLVLKLINKLTSVSTIIGVAYLPPENGHYGRDSSLVLNHLLNIVYENAECDFMLIGGDFNARTGDLSDVIEGIDDINLPKRQNSDNVINKHGHDFIDFLKDSKMCILNGRFGSGNENFTSVSHRGSAVVDYFSCTL